MTEQRNLLTAGLALTMRNWPAFVWTYVFNLGTALLFTLPLRAQLSAITAHSLASQRLTGGFDLSAMAGLLLKLSKGSGADTLSSNFTAPVFVVLYFLIVPGTLLCYQSGARPRLAMLFHTGFTYFWRFIRITLVNLVISGLILGGLMALQKLWSAHIDETVVGRKSFVLELIGVAIIALIASALRLYFDLVEVYTVQLGLQAWPEGATENPKRRRQIRHAFMPALRAFGGTFIVLGALGLCIVAFTARMAMHSLAKPHVWPLFLLAQIGLFLMLFTRFWQRGAETILALDNPLPLPHIIVPEPVAAEVIVITPVITPPDAEPEPSEEGGYDPEALEAPPTEAKTSRPDRTCEGRFGSHHLTAGASSSAWLAASQSLWRFSRRTAACDRRRITAETRTLRL
jgi:hypothetical protein